jgi:hypothetical protein
LFVFFRPVFFVTLPCTLKEATMKLQIYLTDTMAADLLTLAQCERRFPRQQAEVLLERALKAAVQHKGEAFGRDSTTEVDHAPAAAQ